MSADTDDAAAAIYALVAIMQRGNNSPEAEQAAYERLRLALAPLALGDQLGAALLNRPRPHTAA